AALEEEGREAAQLVDVLGGDGRDGVDLQARLAALELDERVVGRQRLREALPVAPEPVVVGGHAVERELEREVVELAGREELRELRARPLGEEAVARAVDPLHAVLADEALADLGEVAAQEGLAAGEREALDRTERVGQREELVARQVVPPVQLLPVEAV